ncbi:MAG: LPS export ABC transporter periplasmic protein LptC [Rhodocyclaceae bacterium]|nr:LPS export ABC transporter periplasmic protein LptC [Rhodocyclaceae bacterium]
MRLSLQHLFPLLALGALAGGSLWLERITRSPEEASAAARASGPDVIVDQMAVTRFDINGVPHYTLDARNMTHLPGEAHSHLDDPVMHYTRDTMRLQLAARSAIARDDGERIDLAGEVRGERALPDQPVSTFASESLTLWPRVESAKTTDPVLLTQNGAEVRGNGMTADNIFGLITLTGRVDAYMPVKRKTP